VLKPAHWRDSLPDDSVHRNEVHIWRTPIQCDATTVENAEALLSSPERDRAEQFRFLRDRESYIVVRGTLRRLLSTYLNCSPAAIALRYGHFGKPELDVRHAASRLQFSVSHTAGLALFAFAKGRRVGVDLEMINEQLVDEAVARRCLSGEEMKNWRATPTRNQANLFFSSWTRKEAWVKASGVGMQTALTSVVLPDVNDASESRYSHHLRYGVCSFQPAPGYSAAVVAEGENWQPAYYNWPVCNDWKPTRTNCDGV
jgi:4'-phosphopantetheinyl transferase